MSKQIFDNPKFIIYKAENGWALYVPKDESSPQDLMGSVMGKFGLGGGAPVESNENAVSGLFLFDSFPEMTDFIKEEFKQEVSQKKQA